VLLPLARRLRVAVRGAVVVASVVSADGQASCGRYPRH